MTSEKCRTCYYGTRVRSEIKTLGNICDFFSITGQRRGCPAGDECTRYKEGKRPPMYMRIKTKQWMYGK